MSLIASTNESPSLDYGEEVIKVAIRMRPLNAKEETGAAARVWRVSEKQDTVIQTTGEGKDISERVSGRNFFTFDKTFGEDSTTKEVYDDIVRGIVRSVTRDGLDGTIFAYGQTSSGKTYTMQGAGTIQEGSQNGDGIIHMAARDVFSHIASDPERLFLLRVSFIEIYNEEIRDLLAPKSDKGLAIREDPVRGIFVNANESIVTNLESLLGIMFAAEKNRSVASTGMNTRSSRSHTIFRITIESRKKRAFNNYGGIENTSDSEDDDCMSCRSQVKDDDDAVMISTLNMVDLAGSESVKHTGATGDRRKEGGKINQSLLTLSQVISKLGSKALHVNFRDSKLTRILQPSLSGNARMAVICCATPSELYLEETRSTLQFAARAKLVKTRAQVNEVLDDRSLIKKLQRELVDARRAACGIKAMEQIKSLETEAANSESAAKRAEEKVRRLKATILKGGVLHIGLMLPGGKRSTGAGDFGFTGSSVTYDIGLDMFGVNNTDWLHANSIQGKESKRHKSESALDDDILRENKAIRSDLSPSRSSPAHRSSMLLIQSPMNELQPRRISSAPGSTELALLREALSAKSNIVRSLESKLLERQARIVKANNKRDSIRISLQKMKMTKEETETDLIALQATNLALLDEKHQLQALLLKKEGGGNEVVVKLEIEKEELAKKVAFLSKENESIIAADVLSNQALSDLHVENLRSVRLTSQLESELKQLKENLTKIQEYVQTLEIEKLLSEKKTRELSEEKRNLTVYLEQTNINSKRLVDENAKLEEMIKKMSTGRYLWMLLCRVISCGLCFKPHAP